MIRDSHQVHPHTHPLRCQLNTAKSVKVVVEMKPEEEKKALEQGLAEEATGMLEQLICSRVATTMEEVGGGGWGWGLMILGTQNPFSGSIGASPFCPQKCPCPT